MLCLCVCVCVCKCVMDHMSEHEVCGDLADKQWCFTLKRQNCDTPKTPEARFWIQLSILSPSFHRPSSWSVPLFSLPSLALSCIFFLFFIREDGGFTLTQYAQVFPAAPRIGIRWSESLPVASSMIISNHRSKRTFQKSSRFLENKSDPDICLQISRRGLQSKRLHRLRGWNIYELGEGEAFIVSFIPASNITYVLESGAHVSSRIRLHDFNQCTDVRLS